ncbi:MAG: flavodoxin family protein [Candidatus Bathyarchaeota archaeon]|jgi:multimeric flavodoxin WrbA
MMRCLALHSSPNKDGLTVSTAQAVLDGFASEGGEVELLHLNHMDIKPCKACERGWGSCRDGDCIQDDDLDLIRDKIQEADTFVFATPVYWHDLSESAKRFLDRLRRTETFSGRETCLGTRAIGIAAAGGSGNGAARALYNLEDYLKRVGFEIVDLVTITKFSKDHKLPMLEHAGKRLAKGAPGVAPRR